MIVKINIFSFLILNKSIFDLFFKNYSFNLIFLLQNPNIYIFKNLANTRYSWTDTFEYSGIYINFITLKPEKFYNFKKNSESMNLNDVIILKKKSSMLKKNSDKKHITLNKIVSNKDNFNKFYFKNFSINYDFKNNSVPMFFKNFDLSRNIKPSIKLNRSIAKEFYNLKYYRNFSLSKNLKKYNTLDKKSLIFSLENKLISILMRSDIFFNLNDCIWFIKNKLISVNASLIINSNFILKPFDIINISHNNYYYNFYQYNLDYLLKKIPKINQKVWFINNLKFKNKDEDIKYPNWIDSYKYFKKDIPINLEIDYISMTIIILNYKFNNQHLDFYNYKFINLYLNRLYNWKFVN